MDTPANERKKGDDPFSNWLLSLGFMIIAPCFPLFKEQVMKGTIAPDMYYLTGAVLCASYGIASLHHLYRFGYLCLFVGLLSVDFKPEGGASQLLNGMVPIGVMLVVVIIHAIERYDWRMPQNRLFPDWREGN